MAPQNWNDDFDFDDDVPKKKPAPQKKKPAPRDTDFFDDDQNANKLPSISSKNLLNKQININQNKRSSAKQNPYAENMKLRGNIYDDYENAYQQLEEQPKSKKDTLNNNTSKKKNSVADQVDYYQQIDQEPKKQVKNDKKTSVLKKQQPVIKKQTPVKKPVSEPQQQQNYEQEVFEDGYGDDFEQVQQPPKQQPKKIQPVINTDPPKKKSLLPQKVQSNPQTQVNNQRKAPPIPPSRSSAKQAPQRNLTVDKNPVLGNQQRSKSRQSMKSAGSKRGNQSNQSRVQSNKFATNLSFVPNKYTTQIEKSFPDQNLNQLNQDKLNKLNQKLRGMIKKFNQSLNDLINKNMLYLKQKKQQKQPNVENKLRVLQQQSKNNQTMIQVMQKQFDKLSGRDGQLRQQQYQLMMQKRIQQTKEQIKQHQKLIVKLKNQVKSQGNKLTNKNQDKKLAAQLHHLKTTLIQSKKDQQKNGQRLQKLQEQMQDLSQKITDIDYKLSQLYDQAKEKGVQLESKEELNKKFDTIKKKLQASKNHRSKLQNLLKTKSDIVSHQKQQLRINIKNCQLQIKNLYDSISHVHNQSVKVVQKAKTNPKLSPNIVSDLDGILKSLQLVQPDNYSVRSESNRSQASNRPLKNSDIGNMEKSEPQKRSQSANNDKHLQMHASEDNSKPNLLKKKLKVNDMPQQKKMQGQRVWKDDDKQKQKQKKQKLKQQFHQKQIQKAKQKQRERERQKQPEKPVEQQKDKKKPFTLKKNRISQNNKPNQPEQNNQKNEGQGLRLQIEGQPKKQEEQKKQQISLAGPRMMKFRKRGEQKQKQVSKQDEKPPQKLVLQTPKQPVQQQKAEQQKPVFAPKRFNLRNRQQKKQQSYVPSIENKQKQQPKKQQPKKQQVKKQQYKPKFNFGDVQDNFKKPAYDPFQKKEEKKEPAFILPNTNEEKKDDEEVKPKFNLRLRDRKKNTEDVGGGGYMPTINNDNNANKAEQKPMINIPKQNNNQYNPSMNLAANKPQNNQPKEQPKFSVPQQPVNNPYAPKQNGLNIGANRQGSSLPKQQPKIAVQQPINNPYAPKEEVNANQQGRKKQGPVKKPKIQQQGQKQKINIYEQAQQAQGLNEFVTQPKKQPEYNFNQGNNQNNGGMIATKDLNLNDLLGVKKNKGGGDDLADLLGTAGNNKKAKKNNDFFGDLDL